MRDVEFATQFNRDVRRMERRGKDMRKLRSIIELLARGDAIPEHQRDHPLHGTWETYRDVHVEPDWIVIYKVAGNLLRLARTGSHSDLFGR
jgi:mRNA interferase YafQ